MSDIKKQLVQNQLWETVAFAAKAVFLFLLTPIMLQVWGKEGYGAFAVASSTVVFIFMFDLGLRGRIRVELCQAFFEQKPGERERIMAFAVSRFLLIALLVFLVVAAVSAAGLWSHWLDLPVGQEHLIVVTTALTEIYMLSGFFQEPLVAEGRIGHTKQAAACGFILAIPAVWFVLHTHGHVVTAIAVWLGCLALANYTVAWITGHLGNVVRWKWNAALQDRSTATLAAGVWFNITNITWLAKNHGLTFLISALFGPAAAGSFFIILRLSEIIGSFGAISSDVVLGGLATGAIEQRQRVFSTAYSYAALLSLLLTFCIGFGTPLFWQFWLKTQAPLGWITGWLAALLGLSSGLNRIIVNAAMSLGMEKKTAFWCVIELTLALAGALIAARYGGPIGGMAVILILASAAIVGLVPVARAISRCLQQSFWKTWCPQVGRINS